MDLPEHLIHDIFLNLPAKRLIRFRSLSKEWNNAIASPAFANRHFHYNNNSRRRRVQHLLVLFPWLEEYEILQCEFADNTTSLWSEDTQNSHCPISFPSPTTSVRIPIPMHAAGYTCFSQSTCHGMMCMTFIDKENRNATTLVWNPATRQYREVPWPVLATPRVDQSSLFVGFGRLFVGFGYDHVVDDYKIVLTVSSYDGLTYKNHMHIMTLKSNNIWRSVETSDWGTRQSDSETLDGFIYWVNIPNLYSTYINDWRNIAILKFNIMDESLTILPGPPEKKCRWMRLGQYRGSLCLFNYEYFAAYGDREHWANIWTLAEDDEGKATWNKLMDVPLFPRLRSYHGHQPCGFTMSGDLVICAIDRLLIYLVRQKKLVEFPLDHPTGAKTATLSHFHVRTATLLHFETLISPASINYV